MTTRKDPLQVITSVYDETNNALRVSSVAPSYTLATLPTGSDGQVIFVSDATPVSICFFNGTNWISVLTGVAVV